MLLEVFAQGVRALLNYTNNKDHSLLDEARTHLARVNYRVDIIQGNHLYIQENMSRRGWGSYAINLHADNQLVVEVPAPFDERGTMEAGAKLFAAMEAKALAIAGSNRRTNADGSRGSSTRGSRSRGGERAERHPRRSAACAVFADLASAPPAAEQHVPARIHRVACRE